MLIVNRVNHCTYYVLGDEVIPKKLRGIFSDWTHLTQLVEGLGYKYSRQLSEELGLVVYQRQ